MKRVSLAIIRFYQRAISPLQPAACRFEPTCSEYGYQAIQRHGVVRGIWMTARRMGRCHPLHKGGYDPVP